MKRKKWIRTLLVLFVCIGGLWLYANRGAGEVEPYAAPAWQLRDPDGQLISSADFEGDVLVVNFWATWCPPCRREIPGFTEVQEELGPEGLTIVGISLDEAPVEAVQTFAEDYGVNYPVVMGNAKVVQDFGGVRVLPTTYFIDREGQVRNVHKGYLSKRGLKQTIRKLL